MATFAASVEKWRALVDAMRGDLPLDFLLNWITHESAGNPCSTGIPGKEAGIGQSYHPDDDRFGATFAELRAACDGQKQTRPLTHAEQVRQVAVLVNMVRAARESARKQLASASVVEQWPEPDFYALVKLRHVLPGLGANYLPAFTRAKGRPPRGWKEWRTYVEQLDDTAFTTICPACAPWRSAQQRARLFNNAERTATVLGAFGSSGGFVSRELLVALGVAAAALAASRFLV